MNNSELYEKIDFYKLQKMISRESMAISKNFEIYFSPYPHYGDEIIRLPYAEHAADMNIDEFAE
ncbi:unnamed protein product, partial [marine sediment metagenome]